MTRTRNQTVNDLHPIEKAAEFVALELGVKVANAMLLEQHPEPDVREYSIRSRANRARSRAITREMIASRRMFGRFSAEVMRAISEK
jgi:hypothetical protein